MILGRRFGCPLLGKWHLSSFVVSVIGPSTLSADNSPREVPPACQLHSVRVRPLIFLHKHQVLLQLFIFVCDKKFIVTLLALRLLPPKYILCYLINSLLLTQISYFFSFFISVAPAWFCFVENNQRILFLLDFLLSSCSFSTFPLETTCPDSVSTLLQTGSETWAQLQPVISVEQ